MPNSTELSEMMAKMDEALSLSMKPEVRRDLSALRFATSMRLALREKFPQVDKAEGTSS